MAIASASLGTNRDVIGLAGAVGCAWATKPTDVAMIMDKMPIGKHSERNEINIVTSFLELQV